jgi:hypothetical protein
LVSTFEADKAPIRRVLKLQGSISAVGPFLSALLSVSQSIVRILLLTSLHESSNDPQIASIFIKRAHHQAFSGAGRPAAVDKVGVSLGIMRFVPKVFPSFSLHSSTVIRLPSFHSLSFSFSSMTRVRLS